MTLVRKDNGDVYEYDPEAEAPKKLSDPKLILNEQKSVEMLFYREVQCKSQENSECRESESSHTEQSEESKEDSNES